MNCELWIGDDEKIEIIGDSNPNIGGGTFVRFYISTQTGPAIFGTLEQLTAVHAELGAALTKIRERLAHKVESANKSLQAVA
jgi:hypothetical protein